jgi:hypothetical protein
MNLAYRKLSCAQVEGPCSRLGEMQNLETQCRCECGADAFEIRPKRDEQVGLLTCAQGHYSLLLDSRDYWADVLQDGRPRASRCRCGSLLFAIGLTYEFRDNGDVRTIDVTSKCHSCGRAKQELSCNIKYSPTDRLLSHPLDPIEKPWFQPKRREMTAYWQAGDAQRFATYLVESGARVFRRLRQADNHEECALKDIQFFPELECDLCFTNLAGVIPASGFYPQRSGPFLQLGGPYHIVLAGLDDVALLHYVRYAEEISNAGELQRQPEEFLLFARSAMEWLKKNFISERGRNTADNPEEFVRMRFLLRRN